MKPKTSEVKEKPVTKEKKIKKQKTKAKPKCKRVPRIRCPICFSNLGKEPFVSTRCGHVFCRDCLQKALLVKSACPTCRRKVTSSQGYHNLYLDENVFDDSKDDGDVATAE